jgi:hypothetical protein
VAPDTTHATDTAASTERSLAMVATAAVGTVGATHRRQLVTRGTPCLAAVGAAS